MTKDGTRPWRLTWVDEPLMVDPQRDIPRTQPLIPNILHRLDTQRRQHFAQRQRLSNHRELFRLDERADRVENVPVAVGVRGDARDREAGLHAVLCVDFFHEFRETGSRVELGDVEGVCARGRLAFGVDGHQHATRKTRTTTHIVHVLNAGPLGMSGIIRTPCRRRKEGNNGPAQEKGCHQDLPLAVPVESVEKRDEGRQEHVDEESGQDGDDDFRWGFLDGGG
jgi:hypothetical protein